MLVRDTLVRLNLLRPVQKLRNLLPFGSAAYKEQQRTLARFKAEFGPAFNTGSRRSAPRGRALLFGLDTISGVALHSVVIAAFREAGYTPVVVLPAQSYGMEEAYRCLGIDEFLFLERFRTPESGSAAARLLTAIAHGQDILQLMERGCRVGRAALSTLMRRQRSGQIDLSDPALRPLVEAALTESVAAAQIAHSVFESQRPDAVVFIDRGYTPTAQFFDLAIASGIPVFTWNAGHRNNILMLKRYSTSNGETHPFSLAPATWALMRKMTWGPEQWQRALTELESCYRTGQWFSEVGTQINKTFLEPAEIRDRLGLDPRRKIAAVFPHIFWDATFFWGTDLFANYEEWFLETMRCAAANPQVDWLVKIHPANLVKDRRDGHTGEHSEILALRKLSPDLPPNVRLIPADSDISTFSLFSLIDYCLTVRGTVGMEAACFGIPVITAGTGRYDRLGFTIDPNTAEEYRSLIARIHDLPRMQPGEVELARRFAFGALLARPLSLDTLQMDYTADANATLNVSLRKEGPAASGRDVRSLASWIAGSSEDYLADEFRPTR